LGNVLLIGELLEAHCDFFKDGVLTLNIRLGCKWLKVTKLTSRVTKLGNVLRIGLLWEA
jgi:hypothetical protein